MIPKFFRTRIAVLFLLSALLVYLVASSFLPFLRTGLERYIMLFFGTLLALGLVVALISIVKIVMNNLLRK